LIAFGAVVLQGVLGGLRVTAIKDEIGIFHAVLAQLFFCLTCALVLFTSRWWTARQEIRNPPLRSAISLAILGTTFLILVQLALGATMRHAHAGLAIPDFPLAYGSVWPDMSSAAVERYNQQRLEVTAVNEITAGHIALQLAHRLLAVVILFAVAWCAWSIGRADGFRHLLSRLALFWAGLILAQFFLGAWTIWSHKAADVATAHVLVGTLTLATGAIMCIIRFRLPSEADERYDARVEAPVSPGQSVGIQTAAGS
jgi:cytochrome c oxidase assembly protein subunit 15